MPVSVNMPQQQPKKDPLDTVLKALQIASSIYGIKTDSQKQDLLKTQKEQEQLALNSAKAANDKAIAENDPTSPLSKAAREAYRSAGIDLGENLSAAQLKSMGPLSEEVKKRSSEELHRKNSDSVAQREISLKEREAAQKLNGSSVDQKLSKLSGTDKARFDNAVMALKGLDEMASALDKGQNTFSMVGDNDYTAAERRATEAYGRMQSGGAINKDEESRFQATLPTYKDSAEIQRNKILQQRDEMISRLKTLGFSPQEIGYQPRDFNYGLPKDSSGNTSIAAKKDQAIDSYAKQNGIDYSTAERILKGRGYGGK